MNINRSVNITNGQIGDNNTMTVNYLNKGCVFKDKDWKELKDFLSGRLDEFSQTDAAYLIAKESLNYVEGKDEVGLKGFLKRNKESFLNNVLSDVASSGIWLLLSKLNL